MKVFFSTLRSDRILYVGFLLSVALIILTTVVILFLYRSLPPFIPLYNQLPWGESRLGTKIEIFIPVFLATLIASFYYTVNAAHDLIWRVFFILFSQHLLPQFW
ncbi:MAG: hypothetical protein HYW64_01660 [Candidatus Levybacteria bacterium]|nr:hypothetical protein [Candidatus Levybacteria bacterium]